MRPLLTRRHRKVYSRTGTGIVLFCGDEVVADNTRLVNWQIDSCPVCGMFVKTTGSSPGTDRVFEGRLESLSSVKEENE